MRFLLIVLLAVSACSSVPKTCSHKVFVDKETRRLMGEVSHGCDNFIEVVEVK